MLLRWMMPCLLLLAAACGNAAHDQTSDQQAAVTLAAPTHWAVFLMAGDISAPVFDNAVTRFRGMLQGASFSSLRSLSADDSKVAPADVATVDHLAAAMAEMPQRADAGCLLFITSHGSHDGFFLKADLDHGQLLTPARLGEILDSTCGQRPTVAIISACYSGVFLDDAAPNRIILTAARADRTSFGCGAAFDYTYYDSCLLDHWPLARNFVELYAGVVACVREKERVLGVVPSEPQASFGTAVADLPLPR
jgi:hypothetical protein